MHFKLIQELSKLAHFSELKEITNNSNLHYLEKGDLFNIHSNNNFFFYH